MGCPILWREDVSTLSDIGPSPHRKECGEVIGHSPEEMIAQWAGEGVLGLDSPAEGAQVICSKDEEFEAQENKSEVTPIVTGGERLKPQSSDSQI